VLINMLTLLSNATEQTAENDFMLKCAKQALKIYKEASNLDRAEEAIGYVSFTLINSGRLQAAIELWEKLLETAIKKYGLQHECVAIVQVYLGTTYIEANQWDKAETQMRKALSHYKKTNCPMSVDIRNVQGHLATILRDSGRDLDEATRLFQEVLDWNIAHFGKHRPSVLWTAASFARCLQLKGSTLTALKTYEEAYPILRKTYGENHFIVKDVRRWMRAAKSDEEKEEEIKTDYI